MYAVLAADAKHIRTICREAGYAAGSLTHVRKILAQLCDLALCERGKCGTYRRRLPAA